MSKPVNTFVLTTGRSGSVSFIAACRHISNYSATHESRTNKIGTDHFDYPKYHIEADNRLSWFLGTLDKKFGHDAFYVHLVRDRSATAESFSRRYDSGIIKAYKEDILQGSTENLAPLDVCKDYYDTVNENISFFLRDKPNVMKISLETINEEFPVFWKKIGAEGDLCAAMDEWSIPQNASKPPFSSSRSLARKAARAIRGLPEYLRRA